MPDNSDRIEEEQDPLDPPRQLPACSRRVQNKLHRCKSHCDEGSFLPRRKVSHLFPICRLASLTGRTLVIGMAKYAIDMNRIRVRAASTAPVHASSNHGG